MIDKKLIQSKLPNNELIAQIRQANLEKNKILDINFDKINSERMKCKLRSYILRRESKIGFNIGYMGEAYIYEALIRLGCFSKITWTAQTKDHENPSIILNNGHRYFIHDKGGRFDIHAIDYEGKEYYFEVKATVRDHKNAKVCKKQLKFASELNNSNQFSILANVTNALSDHPVITYYLFDKEFIEIDIQTDNKDIHLVKKMISEIQEEDNTMKSNSDIQSDSESDSL